MVDLKCAEVQGAKWTPTRTSLCSPYTMHTTHSAQETTRITKHQITIQNIKWKINKNIGHYMHQTHLDYSIKLTQTRTARGDLSNAEQPVRRDPIAY